MPSSSQQVIYLGRFADADTSESSFAIEDGGVYQQTFGTAQSPLKDSVITAEFHDDNSNGNISTDNFGSGERID